MVAGWSLLLESHGTDCLGRSREDLDLSYSKIEFEYGFGPAGGPDLDPIFEMPSK